MEQRVAGRLKKYSTPGYAQEKVAYSISIFIRDRPCLFVLPIVLAFWQCSRTVRAFRFLKICGLN